MESVENQQGKRYSGNNSPGQESEELSLYPHGDVPMSHEGVKDPESDVCKQHKGYNLPPRLSLLLSSSCTNSPTSLADNHA